MTYRVTKRLLAHAESKLVPSLARIYRPLLFDTRFVAVTGSCGKTTTKELIADILTYKHRTHRSFDSNNIFFSVARTILEVRPWHRFLVMEMSASGPGSLKSPIELLKPDIAVVTAIGEDHYKAFRGAAAAAAEKQQLVEALADNGVAVLNSDDPLVMAMVKSCRGGVLSYGLGESADVRGRIAEWRWPEFLTLDVTYRGQQARVSTRLLGAHQATPVLAAIATGVACGLSLAECAAAVATTKPVFGRMSSKIFRGEVTFIHDNFKAPLWTMGSVISYLGAARADRTMLVIGTVSDYGGNAASKYRSLAESALVCIDHVVFASRYAPSHLRKLQVEFRDRLHLFPNTESAASFIRGFVAPGDLVLLKGSLRSDHLERIPITFDAQVHCWISSCGREVFCHQCDLRNTPSADA